MTGAYQFGGRVRLMFSDEAGFGRISIGAACWTAWERPCFPSHQIREYMYAYGAVDPMDGEHHFLVLPKCNTECENMFLQSLSERYPDDWILLVADNATWHHSKTLEIPENIVMTYIPPYTPEMNPIEQIWKELRAHGFKNTAFPTLATVTDKLCEAMNGLENSTVKSITGREWILEMK